MTEKGMVVLGTVTPGLKRNCLPFGCVSHSTRPGLLCQDVRRVDKLPGISMPNRVPPAVGGRSGPDPAAREGIETRAELGLVIHSAKWFRNAIALTPTYLNRSLK
jgi:hypothetical protein